ncbi:MAG TPA: hypothetical protein VLX32_14595 [Candidatus Acidoferrum sp.]|nr:hypothetical protein [Candidatus Acidoferrum sp.]
MSEKRSMLSRREFARRAALASAGGTLVPVGSILGAQTSASTGTSALPEGFPKLSQQSQVEAEARFDAILREYPSRFPDAEKKDLRRLCYAIQPPLDHLRSYAIENGDSPALYLKPIVERERRVVSPQKFLGKTKKP